MDLKKENCFTVHSGGVEFVGRVVFKGDPYGAYDKKAETFALVHTDSRPVVAFYDSRYSHTPYGQFTGGSYFMETLLGRADRDPGLPRGLCLDGGVDDWSLDQAAFVNAVFKASQIIAREMAKRIDQADLARPRDVFNSAARYGVEIMQEGEADVRNSTCIGLMQGSECVASVCLAVSRDGSPVVRITTGGDAYVERSPLAIVNPMLEIDDEGFMTKGAVPAPVPRG